MSNDNYPPNGSPEFESAELQAIEAFAKNALGEILPNDLSDKQSRRVFELMRDCDVLYINEETQTNYLYYRYRHVLPDQDKVDIAIQYYLVREASPRGIAWHGAPKHEVAVDMEYMPLPGDEVAVLFPFTYQSLSTADELLDFILRQSEEVDVIAKNYKKGVFGAENDD